MKQPMIDYRTAECRDDDRSRSKRANIWAIAATAGALLVLAGALYVDLPSKKTANAPPPAAASTQAR